MQNKQETKESTLFGDLGQSHLHAEKNITWENIRFAHQKIISIWRLLATRQGQINLSGLETISKTQNTMQLSVHLLQQFPIYKVFETACMKLCP